LTASRANHAHLVFPSNDHTSDRATPFRIDVPDLVPELAVVTDHLDFMHGLVGDSPFSIHGSLVGDARSGCHGARARASMVRQQRR
jgi:hypothetical protein